MTSLRTSRILKRNQSGFSLEAEGEVVSRPLPQTASPLDPLWQWPHRVNTAYKYASYVMYLQSSRGLTISFPRGVFMKFARTHKRYGWEVLTRAAALATSLARHSFSPKFIEQFLDEVPGKPSTISKELF